METDGGVKVHLPNTAVMAENPLFQGGSVAVATATAAATSTATAKATAATA